MKQKLFSIFILLSLFANAQKQTAYYDYNWNICKLENARFVSVVEKTDSGFLQLDYFLSTFSLQMQGLYKDSTTKIKNGNFFYYYPNGNISSMGKYINDKKEGLWLKYYNDGMMEDSANYKEDEIFGISLAWHQNGFLRDSLNVDESGKATDLTWFDNGQLSAAGILLNKKPFGKWKYYHKNGKPSAIEIYEENKLVNKYLFGEDGITIPDTTSQDRTVMFKGGTKSWKIFLQKNLRIPSDYNPSKDFLATVVLAFYIDEEGKISDPFVETPFKTDFDNEALRVIKKAPKWLPAIYHNRRVSVFVRQAISFTFKQEVEINSQRNIFPNVF